MTRSIINQCKCPIYVTTSVYTLTMLLYQFVQVHSAVGCPIQPSQSVCVVGWRRGAIQFEKWVIRQFNRNWKMDLYRRDSCAQKPHRTPIEPHVDCYCLVNGYVFVYIVWLSPSESVIILKSEYMCLHPNGHTIIMQQRRAKKYNRKRPWRNSYIKCGF